MIDLKKERLVDGIGWDKVGVLKIGVEERLKKD